MTHSRSPWLAVALACALLSSSSSSSAQQPGASVPFDVVLNQTAAGPRAAGQRTIQTQAEFAAFFQDWGGPMAPPFVAYDASRTYFGIAYGPSAAGSEVEIVAVRRVGLGAASPGGGPAAPNVLVAYRERTGPWGGGAPVYPVSLVSVPRLAPGEVVTFVPAAPQPTVNFDRIELEWTRLPATPTGSLQATTLTLSSDGSVRAVRGGPASIQDVSDGLEPGERARLVAAVAGASMGTVPPTLAGAPTGPTFSLEVRAPLSDLDGRTAGTLDAYGAYEAQLRPLIAVLIELADRVLGTSMPGTLPVLGQVEVQGGQVVLVTASGRLTVEGPPAEVLRHFEGASVEVEGQTGPGAPGGQGSLFVTRYLNPEPIERELPIYVQGGEVHAFFDGGLRRLSGEVAAVLAGSDGERAYLSAYALRSAGDVTQVHVDRVRAEARITRRLTLSGQFAGVLNAGDQAWITAVSRTGRYGRVEAPGGDGYVLLSALRIGAPIPAATPGLSGTLGGQ